jgi:hypothetical protein
MPARISRSYRAIAPAFPGKRRGPPSGGPRSLHVPSYTWSSAAAAQAEGERGLLGLRIQMPKLLGAGDRVVA